jgi:hypothetical protein
MKTPEQWAQEIELRCVADNRRPRIAVEADVIWEAISERVGAAIDVAKERRDEFIPRAPGDYRDGNMDAATVIWLRIDLLKFPDARMTRGI